MSIDHYEAPVIQKLQGGFMNKFGNGDGAERFARRSTGSRSMTCGEQFGSPLFVFSEQRSASNTAKCTTPSRATIPTWPWPGRTRPTTWRDLLHHAPGRLDCRSCFRHGI